MNTTSLIDSVKVSCLTLPFVIYNRDLAVTLLAYLNNLSWSHPSQK